MLYQECSNLLAAAIGILRQAERDQEKAPGDAAVGLWEQLESNRGVIADGISRAVAFDLRQEVARFCEALAHAQSTEKQYMAKRWHVDGAELDKIRVPHEQAVAALRERILALVARMGIALEKTRSRNWSRGHGR